MKQFDQMLTGLAGHLFPTILPRGDAQRVPRIRACAEPLADLGSGALRERAEEVRRHIAEEGVDAEQPRIEAFALMFEALRRARGIALYDVQLQASLALARGTIAEMQTGEGKTFSCAPAAYLHALTGRGVHVATPNAYLAERDYELLRPAFELLGVSAGLLQEGADAGEKRAAYRCDITYGTGYEFGFDYLRDQLALRDASHRSLGSKLLDALASSQSTTAQLTQRGLYFSIVDEADQVLLDDAASPLILSGAASGEAADAEAHRAARQLIGELSEGLHYELDAARGTADLTEAGIARVHRDRNRIPISQLHRTWTEYVEQALRAEMLRRDVHYVLDQEGAIQIVDAGTGRIFSDRTWSDGLHQAVEAKEGVRITPEKQAMAQITRQRFYRLYERLAGMTGTASGCERELRQVYRLDVVPIPLRTASQRVVWPARFFANRQVKWNAIADSVDELHALGRPVLVGTRSIEDSEELAVLFRERGLHFELLNGRQNAAEAAIVAQAGQLHAITIATSLAGRGTDIKLGPGVAERGGLHVIICECYDSARGDRQLIGRCARQGDPGSAQLFVSAEDALIRQYAGWATRSLERSAGPDGELPLDISTRIRRIQRMAEEIGYGARCALLRHDLARDSLYCGRPKDL